MATPRKTPQKTKQDTPEVQTPDINEELAQANASFSKENETLLAENRAKEEELAALRSQLAKNNPVLNSQRLESEEMQVGQDREFSFDKRNNVIQEAGTTLDDPNMLAKLDIEKFMNEPVTVQIGESTVENADHAFSIAVNGRQEFFREGEIKTVERKYVEGLARAKKTTYKNVKKDRPDGDNDYVYVPKTGNRYPFSVITDANPMGASWLQAVLRQP